MKEVIVFRNCSNRQTISAPKGTNDSTVKSRREYLSKSKVADLINASCFIMGLKSDGTAVTAEGSYYHPDDVADWKLFDSIDTLEEERASKMPRALEKWEMERLEKKWQEEKLQTEKSALKAKLANLPGLFTGKHRRKIEERLAEIEYELKNCK